MKGHDSTADTRTPARSACDAANDLAAVNAVEEVEQTGQKSIEKKLQKLESSP